jgi:acetyl-CoA decarbonylase/synthase complex subunit gamma
MPLSGIQIYKLLPQTNCKDCGYPTCLAFAMKLGSKQAELSACPHVSEASKTQLAESSAPPMRLITLKGPGTEVKVGNETVMFRHDKTFYNQPGLFYSLTDTEPEAIVQQKASFADGYTVNYVGMELALDGFALESVSDDPGKFEALVGTVRKISGRPLILISRNPEVIAAGLKPLTHECVLICGADLSNWKQMAGLAKASNSVLVVCAESLDELADLSEKIRGEGVEDLVLNPGDGGLNTLLARSTQIRRLALKKNFRALGFPIISFPSRFSDPALCKLAAAQSVAKYTGFIVLGQPAAEDIYPLLVLRQNIYSDPQKPIQVQPGLYEINNPKPEDPVLVTTNFSITYFSVANEVEGCGRSCWLVITDSEGMSVLTAWSAGKFDAARIAKMVKECKVGEKVSRKRLVLPGYTAMLSGETEEALPGWEIKVGPREAVDIPAFFRQGLS